MFIFLPYRIPECSIHSNSIYVLWRCINNYPRTRVYFYVHVTSRAAWHLTLCKNKSLSRLLFRAYGKLANYVGVNLGLDRSPTMTRGFPIPFHIPHQVPRFQPSRITENMDFKVKKYLLLSNFQNSLAIFWYD